MEWERVALFGLGLICALIGHFVRENSRRVEKVEDDSKDLRQEISAHRETVAGMYATRQELKEVTKEWIATLQELQRSFNEHFNKIESKIDHIFERRAHTRNDDRL